MPKLKPSPDEIRERNFNAIVSAAACRLGLKSDCEIAKLLGLRPTTYCYRMKNKGAWSYSELVRLFRKLHVSPDEIASIF